MMGTYVHTLDDALAYARDEPCCPQCTAAALTLLADAIDGAASRRLIEYRGGRIYRRTDRVLAGDWVVDERP